MSGAGIGGVSRRAADFRRARAEWRAEASRGLAVIGVGGRLCIGMGRVSPYAPLGVWPVSSPPAGGSVMRSPGRPFFMDCATRRERVRGIRPMCRVPGHSVNRVRHRETDRTISPAHRLPGCDMARAQRRAGRDR